MAGSALALLLMAAGSLFYEWRSFSGQLSHDLEAQAEIVGESATGMIEYDERERAENEALAPLQHNPHIRAVAIYAISQQPSTNSQLFAWVPKSAAAGAFPVRAEMGAEHSHFDFAHDRLQVWEPLTQAGSVVGTIYIESDLQEIRDRLARTAEIYGWLIVLTLLATYWLATRLRRVVSGPVSGLMETVRKVS